MDNKTDISVFSRPIGAGSTPEVTNPSPVENNAPESPYLIELRDIHHTFNPGTKKEFNLFNGFNLTVEDAPGRGEVISLMGGSGCGKSCILKIISGPMDVDSGEVFIHGKPFAEYGNVPMVFQAYSSFPWMTVQKNVALPMIKKGMKKKEAMEKAMEYIKVVGLEQHARKYANPSELSGGQLQRVSIARCLAGGSKVFLLDEATGALDIKMKKDIQDLILRLAYESDYHPTIINVTHSVDEALYLSNKIIVLKANPCTIYKEIDINYGPGTRDGSVMETMKFIEYKKEVTKALNEACV